MAPSPAQHALPSRPPWALKHPGFATGQHGNTALAVPWALSVSGFCMHAHPLPRSLAPSCGLHFLLPFTSLGSGHIPSGPRGRQSGHVAPPARDAHPPLPAGALPSSQEDHRDRWLCCSRLLGLNGFSDDDHPCVLCRLGLQTYSVLSPPRDTGRQGRALQLSQPPGSTAPPCRPRDPTETTGFGLGTQGQCRPGGGCGPLGRH